MAKSITRDDLSRKVAKEANLTYNQTLQILKESERVIFNLLKERSRVTIHGFGTFYIRLIKSHTIKQIRTKSPRLILEREAIKFKTAPTFKDDIYSRVRKKQTKTEEGIKNKELRVDSCGVKIERPQEITKQELSKVKVEQASPQKPQAKITFAPTLHPRVEHGSMREKIRERLIGLARNKQAEPPKTEVVREALIFGRLLRQIEKTGTRSISFSFNKDKIINIYSGRPRRQLSHLPREIVEGFLRFANIEEFHIPQERHLLVSLSDKGDDKIKINIHLFPLDGGASIHIGIG